jgi:hypothetical protein
MSAPCGHDAPIWFIRLLRGDEGGGNPSTFLRISGRGERI